MFLLVICEILGLLVNIWTADDTFSLRYTENLPKRIKMQLFKKQNFFSQFAAAFLISTSNFEYFVRKDVFIAHLFLKIWTAKDIAR